VWLNEILLMIFTNSHKIYSFFSISLKLIHISLMSSLSFNYYFFNDEIHLRKLLSI
jgi:hypothetical protein